MRLEQGGYSLQPASLVIHELSFGIQRLADGRRKERFRSYLQNLLSSGLPVLAYDNAAALWHGEQRARLEARGGLHPRAGMSSAMIRSSVSSIEQECPGISRELIRQVLQHLAPERLMELRGRGRAVRWIPLSR